MLVLAINKEQVWLHFCGSGFLLLSPWEFPAFVIIGISTWHETLALTICLTTSSMESLTITTWNLQGRPKDARNWTTSFLYLLKWINFSIQMLQRALVKFTSKLQSQLMTCLEEHHQWQVEIPLLQPSILVHPFLDRLLVHAKFSIWRKKTEK